MPEGYCRIRGYKRFGSILDITVPVGNIAEKQVQDLLKCLAAKEGLSYEEIVGAYAKRNTKRANELLHVQKEEPYPEYECGINPSFIRSSPLSLMKTATG